MFDDDFEDEEVEAVAEEAVSTACTDCPCHSGVLVHHTASCCDLMSDSL